MLKYTIRRMIQSVITIFLIATIVFLLMRLLPTDYYFTEDELMHLNDEQREEILKEAGLRDPVPKQLVRFYNEIIHLDFGESRRIQRGVPVVELVESRFTVSMKNGGIALVISLTVGVLLGVIQTLNKDRLLDHIGAGYTVFVNAVPSIVAFSLILVFGSKVLGLPSLYSS